MPAHSTVGEFVTMGAEGVLALFSIAATVLHKMESGQDWTPEAHIHWLHTTFAIIEGVTAGLYALTPITHCSHMEITARTFATCAAIMFMWLWMYFAAYWDQVFETPEKMKALSMIRKVVMGLSSCAYAIIYIVWLDQDCPPFPADIKTALDLLQAVMDLLIGADALRLGLLCVAKFRESAAEDLASKSSSIPMPSSSITIHTYAPDRPSISERDRISKVSEQFAWDMIVEERPTQDAEEDDEDEDEEDEEDVMKRKGTHSQDGNPGSGRGIASAGGQLEGREGKGWSLEEGSTANSGTAPACSTLLSRCDFGDATIAVLLLFVTALCLFLVVLKRIAQSVTHDRNWATPNLDESGSNILEVWFDFIIPGTAILAIMWGRHYLAAVEAGGVLSTLRGSSHERRSTLSGLVAPDLRIEKLAMIIAEMTQENVSERTAAIKSHFSPVPGGNALEHSAEIPKAQIRVYEELGPPGNLFLPTCRAYIRDVVYPHHANFFERFQEATVKLLDGARRSLRKNRNTLGTTQVEKDFAQLEMAVAAAVKEHARWLFSFRCCINAMTEALEEHDTQGAPPPAVFKTSAKKKLMNMSVFSTNLQCHRSTIKSMGDGDERVTSISTITYGAPTAHALKYKRGGISRMVAALDKFEASTETSDKLHPMVQLDVLVTRFRADLRMSICNAQALPALVCAATEAIAEAIRQLDVERLITAQCVGLLVHEVSLVSTHGKEEAMLDDMATTLANLQVRIELESNAGARGTAASLETLSPSDFELVGVAKAGSARRRKRGSYIASFSNLVIRLQAPSSVHQFLCDAVVEGGWQQQQRRSSTSRRVMLQIPLVPVLFSQGVNEMQTVANQLGTVGSQQRVNRVNAEKLEDYHRQWRANVESFSTLSPMQSRATRRSSLSLRSSVSRGSSVRQAEREQSEQELISLGSESPTAGRDGEVSQLDQVSALVQQVKQRAVNVTEAKDVEILILSALAARLMGGGRTTSCKSAKDRTSMFQTLEVYRWLEWIGQVPRHSCAVDLEVKQAILDSLRGEGSVRLRNCEINIGKAQYAFNSIQQQALPVDLRPPPGTAGGGKS